jgi:HAMP domain-containing protein
MLLGKKFTLAFVVLFITVVIGVFLFYGMAKTMEKDKTVINLSGRQRMLMQKYARELMQNILPMQIHHATLKTAEIATLQIVEDRKQYTKAIIEKLERDDVVEVHPNSDYININGGIPLPATFVQEVSNKVNKKGLYSYNLLSRWNINKEKGLNTDYEKEAFDYLLNKKKSVFSRFMVYNGRYSLRYATADVASTSTCVNCHNSQENSPKRDFKLGDVMGILVVTIPIGTASAETGTFFTASGGKDYGKDTFIKTKKELDTTFNALISGTSTPLIMNTGGFTILPPVNNPAIKSKLIEVQKFWHLAQDNYNKLMTTTPNSMEYILVYNTAQDNVNSAVLTMNEAVNMYQFSSDRKTALFMWWIIGGYLGAALLAIGIGCIFVKKHILLPIKRLASGTKLITDGNLDNNIEVKSNDEVGMLTQNFNDMINNMRESKAQIEMSNWLKTGQSELYEIMQGVNDIPKLSRVIITYLAEYLNAEVGVIYIAEDCSALKIVGGYAYSNSHNRSATFKFGEGLAGQAALEKKTILTTDIPADYIKIDTGWGKAVPRYILIVPLIFMGTVKGVIELGSHNKFTDIQVEFLNTVAKNIAVVFSSAQSNVHIHI